MSDPRLEALRRELGDLDRDILELVARRLARAAEIGHVKRQSGRPTRDFVQEKEVLDRARRTAKSLQLAPELAERILTALIESSLAVQEQNDVASRGRGDGRRALVIGGAGRMGQWFARFLASQGFAVEIADPAGTVPGFAGIADWRSSPLDHDVIVVAAQLRQTRQILLDLAGRPPRGLVFDIGSLKSPLRDPLQALARAGARVASLHPMFGPSTELLSGRHVVLVDAGVPAATREARALFEPTMATLVEMDLESHDRLIAHVLGLSHALNIAFFTALATSGETAPRLAGISSTTFDAQLEVASRVAHENPYLYFEIQALNDYGGPVLEALEAALQRLRALVAGRDEAGFVDLMLRGRAYFDERDVAG